MGGKTIMRLTISSINLQLYKVQENTDGLGGRDHDACVYSIRMSVSLISCIE